MWSIWRTEEWAQISQMATFLGFLKKKHGYQLKQKIKLWYTPSNRESFGVCQAATPTPRGKNAVVHLCSLLTSLSEFIDESMATKHSNLETMHVLENSRLQKEILFYSSCFFALWPYQFVQC